jgi:choline dehydrogenase-like flavoprotein
VAEHCDVVIIGTGAGGGTLAHTLAGFGKRILLLERGDFLPREIANAIRVGEHIQQRLAA